ncbi:MAG: bifunctional UDP-N-acetylglucosamine diphosphorylase/glucosamine-1-phosphate N-acetyltransferase GlmU, partial [Nocardioidaceae bacterium]
REAVSEQLERVSATIEYPIETCLQERQLGTGHAVSCALDRLPDELGGTVLVTYGDIPLLDAATLSALLAEHREQGNAVTVLTAVVTDPAGYGRMLRDDEGSVTGIVEHSDASEGELAITEINSGVYAFDAALLGDALHRLSAAGTANAQGELYLPDVLALAKSDGRGIGALVTDDPWLVEGVNDRAQLARLGAECNRRLTEHWMRAGVTMTDPASTWLDAGVTLAPDVLLEPGVQLRGDTTVGEGAVVGPDTTLTDVRVGAGASVVRTHGSGASVAAGASVGPFAYLRPGAVLGEGGKIGTFVEVKKSTIGAGTKVPHLTYVGDATIGEYSNIGAASVFVNYDGVDKHQTVVGSYCRTGSDTMFVAPVTVGDGAYSGAGTVLKEDVPPGALAVSGGKQRTIEGWVVRRRPGTEAALAAERALGSADEAKVESSPTTTDDRAYGKGQ